MWDVMRGRQGLNPIAIYHTMFNQLLFSLNVLPHGDSTIHANNQLQKGRMLYQSPKIKVAAHRPFDALATMTAMN